jgi:hypothetical protein
MANIGLFFFDEKSFVQFDQVIFRMLKIGISRVCSRGSSPTACRELGLARKKLNYGKNKGGGIVHTVRN